MELSVTAPMGGSWQTCSQLVIEASGGVAWTGQPARDRQIARSASGRRLPVIIRPVDVSSRVISAMSRPQRAPRFRWRGPPSRRRPEVLATAGDKGRTGRQSMCSRPLGRERALFRVRHIDRPQHDGDLLRGSGLGRQSANASLAPSSRRVGCRSRTASSGCIRERVRTFRCSQ